MTRVALAQLLSELYFVEAGLIHEKTLIFLHGSAASWIG